MINPNILDNVKISDKPWEELLREWDSDPELHMTVEDWDAIADQMERMGGGNLIGRPSPYNK